MRGDDAYMKGNVLDTIRNMLGTQADDDTFDHELVMWINAAIMRLSQLGVSVTRELDESTRYLTFSDIFSERDCSNAFIPEFITLYVKSVWDPPSNSSAASSLARRLDELSFAINTEAVRGDLW